MGKRKRVVCIWKTTCLLRIGKGGEGFWRISEGGEVAEGEGMWNAWNAFGFTGLHHGIRRARVFVSEALETKWYFEGVTPPKKYRA